MDELLTIDDKEFLVTNRFFYNEKTYLYVIATDGTNELMLLKEYDNNGKTFVKSVTDENEIKNALSNMNK
ncbi:MAG: hypothetical protein ACI4U0_03755 [Candidatus Aphodocola sp.]